MPDREPWVDDEDDLKFCIKFIVARLRIWPQRRKEMTEDVAGMIANEIMAHLKLTNWRIRKGPPAMGHGMGTLRGKN